MKSSGNYHARLSSIVPCESDCSAQCANGTENPETAVDSPYAERDLASTARSCAACARGGVHGYEATLNVFLSRGRDRGRLGLVHSQPKRNQHQRKMNGPSLTISDPLGLVFGCWPGEAAAVQDPSISMVG